MSHAIGDDALDIIFRAARTHNKWSDKPVSDALLMAVYDLMRWGPTAANCSPARILFLISMDAKLRLKPLLSEGNREKTMAAPAVAILGYDLDFAEKWPFLFPALPGLKDAYAGKPELTEQLAFRNASLQGGYFIVAARALGLDCGPMGGFDNDGVDKEFFAGTRIKSNFLCALGHGDPEGVRPRGPRLSFDEACKILMSVRGSESGPKKELLLAVDTALGACSVAVLDGEKILSHRFEEMARGHAEALAPMVQAAMVDAGIGFAELDRLAVTTGPGTFTGQRVGLAFMRGLKVALHKPLVGVTTLEVMAAATEAPKAAAIHDAKREEAYLLLWEKNDVALPPAVMTFAEAVEKIRSFGSCALAGTGAPAAFQALGLNFRLSDIRQPDALWLARLAQLRVPSDTPPAPLYLRAPDAKLPGGISLA